jgi:hypothetical protein
LRVAEPRDAFEQASAFVVEVRMIDPESFELQSHECLQPCAWRCAIEIKLAQRASTPRAWAGRDR